MARAFPSSPDSDTPASERKVFEALREALPANWTVLHSRKIVLPARAGQPAFDREIDFIVLNPSWGFVGLEVKGGGVARTPAGWISIDRDGTEHSIKDPGQQAKSVVYAIKKWLAGVPSSRAWAERVAFGWGVAFPDIDVTEDFGPDLPRALVLDRRGLEDPRSGLEKACRYWSDSTTDFPLAAQDSFVNALAPSLRLVPSLASRIDDEARVLVRLTEEQTQILDVLGEIRRLGVKGGAGTGKTLVAMEKARREAAAGRRVLFLCYNRPLADYLAERATGFTVKTFHQLCRGLARSAGIPFKPDDSGDFWESEAPDRLLEALDAYPDERYDVVIVDEGQDFLEYWWVAIEKLLANPKTGILWVFYDPHQNIYGGELAEISGLQPASLKWNCRNTRRIAIHASKLVDVDPGVRGDAPDGVAVEEFTCKTDAEMVQTVRKCLHRFVIEERISTDRIIVVSVRSAQASPVWRARRLGALTLVEFPAKPGSNEVQFASLQRFKGLEADVVVLCDVETERETCTRRHLYVGTSRARHVLVVAKYAAKT